MGRIWIVPAAGDSESSNAPPWAPRSQVRPSPIRTFPRENRLMLRLLLVSSTAFVLVATAAAQTTPHLDKAARIIGPVKNAGTYHVVTGTWTRAHSVVASFGLSDNIYSNTAQTGYYYPTIGPNGAAALGQLIDEGAVPGTTNPTVFANGGAVTDLNQVTEIQLAYCDFDPTAGVSGWTLSFYEDYAPCTFNNPTPVGTVTVTGFPSNGCWIANLDLTAATGTGEEFMLQADGGAAAPGFDGIPALDSIGISWEYTGTGTDLAGPFISGDPAVTDSGWLTGNPNTGSNTYYGETGGCPGTGSGYGNNDSYWIEDAFMVGGLAQGSTCYWFGGYTNIGNPCGGSVRIPYGAFWMEMSTSLSVSSTVSSPGCVGAVTATGSPAVCEVIGDIVPANNNAEIRASGVPLNQFGIFATGLATIPPSTIFSGNGWICINPVALGGLGRFQGAAQIKNSGLGGTFSLDTTLGEWDLTSMPTSTGSYAVMAGITSNFQAWFREPVATGHNFSGSCSVTWQ